MLGRGVKVEGLSNAFQKRDEINRTHNCAWKALAKITPRQESIASGREREFAMTGGDDIIKVEKAEKKYNREEKSYWSPPGHAASPTSLKRGLRGENVERGW